MRMQCITLVQTGSSNFENFPSMLHCSRQQCCNARHTASPTGDQVWVKILTFLQCVPACSSGEDSEDAVEPGGEADAADDDGAPARRGVACHGAGAAPPAAAARGRRQHPAAQGHETPPPPAGQRRALLRLLPLQQQQQQRRQRQPP